MMQCLKKIKHAFQESDSRKHAGGGSKFWQVYSHAATATVTAHAQVSFLH